MAHAALETRIAVMVGIGLLMTLGVYGLVAAIVKFDDAGLYLAQKPGPGLLPRILRGTGRGILRGAPWLLKSLTLIGTLAMFLVGGGILTHGIPALHHFAESAFNGIAGVMGMMGSVLYDGLVGVLAGLIVVGAVSLIKKWRDTAAPSNASG